MSESGQLPSIPSPLHVIEANTAIAGLEAVAVAWISYYLIDGTFYSGPQVGDWRWYYTVFAVFILLGVMILGLILEGLTEGLERLLTRKIFGKEAGQLRPWYAAMANLPADWGPGQRWMWKSEQASREFARRRLRMLVCRTTATSFLLVGLLSGILALTPVGGGRRMPLAAVFAGCLIATVIFGLLWIDAHRGWNKAVADADRIGNP